jgi:DNA-binding transcriptional ArsR family regulator
MTVPEGFRGLRFPCECVSSRRGGYSEPWAAVAKNKLLPNGTKEEILNLVAREPKTISQVAEALGLSAPSVHTHVSDMLKSELLREAVEWEKTHPAERYYEPNFPVIKEEEAAELCGLCDDLAVKVANLFRKHRRQLENAFRETPLAERGWDFAEVAQYVFASVQRGARELLEQDGTLSPPQTHRNGVEWVFWAEQPKADAKDDNSP